MEPLVVLNLGAGRQSVVLLAMAIAGEIPRTDVEFDNRVGVDGWMNGYTTHNGAQIVINRRENGDAVAFRIN